MQKEATPLLSQDWTKYGPQKFSSAGSDILILLIIWLFIILYFIIQDTENALLTSDRWMKK
jgi:uncharacterized membrane protein YukC